MWVEESPDNEEPEIPPEVVDDIDLDYDENFKTENWFIS